MKRSMISCAFIPITKHFGWLPWLQNFRSPLKRCYPGQLFEEFVSQHDFLAPLQDKLHETIPCVTPPRNAWKIHCRVARSVAKSGLNRLLPLPTDHWSYLISQWIIKNKICPPIFHKKAKWKKKSTLVVQEEGSPISPAKSVAPRISVLMVF